ncbi:MAG: PAS domain-containing protein [Flavipsychrobacter sp.]|nr:PAS domain-containing protein [Flavipsychrobacter sp.]
MSHPLLCWDIILEGRSRRQEFSTDISYLNRLQQSGYWTYSPGRPLDNVLVWENKTILVTNADLKILFASKNIERMNGYQPWEVIGKSPKLFQGPATQLSSRKMIRTALSEIKPFNCTILNYRKDGTLYNCKIEGYPLLNESGRLTNYVAIEEEIDI